MGGSKSAAANGRWAKLLQQVLIATGRTSISLQSTSAICMLLMLPMRFVVIAAGLPGCLVTMTMTTTTTTIARAIDQPAHNSGTGMPKCTQSTRLICHQNRRLSSGYVLHLPTKHRHHHQRSAHYAYKGGGGGGLCTICGKRPSSIASNFDQSHMCVRAPFKCVCYEQENRENRACWCMLG